MERFSENEPLMPKPRPFQVLWSSSNIKRLAVILGILCVAIVILAVTLNVTKGHHLPASHMVISTDTRPAWSLQSVERDYIGPGPGERHSAHGSYVNAAVASDHPICSAIGTDALKKGGSAVDAAIATAVCLGAVNMYTSGLGGAGIMMIYERPRNSTKYEKIILDFLSVAPITVTKDMYDKDPTAKDTGPLSIGVPGEVAGYGAAWERFGRLQWPELFAPTIKMCREGFKVGRAMYEAAALRHPDIIMADPGLREVFINPDGCFLKEGDTLRLPKLANALEKIATDGADTFYTGTLAREVLMDIQHLGGIITQEDLGLYKPIWRTPASRYIKNGNYTVYGSGAPGGGTLLQFCLDVISEYNYGRGMVETEEDRVLYLHRLIETWKMGWKTFQQCEDPAFADHKTLSIISNFDTHHFALDSWKKINDTAAQLFSVYNPDVHSEQHQGSTTSFSIRTPDGAGVVVTTSVNAYFGSGLRGRRTGIIFNNLLEQFSTRGGATDSVNGIEPGKRSNILMSPSIVFDQSNRPILLIGASGGRKLVAAISQVVANLLWFGMTLNDAVDQARVSQDPPPDLILNYDVFMARQVLNGLKEKGHIHLKIADYMAVVQAIDTRTCTHSAHAYDIPCVHAVSDFRKYGVPDGY